MKHLFMTIAMAAAFTACGHRASTDNAAEADSTSVDSTNVTVAAVDTLRTDSIAKEYSDSTAHVQNLRSVYEPSFTEPSSVAPWLVNSPRRSLLSALADGALIVPEARSICAV